MTIQRERRALPQIIQTYEQRVAQETDPNLRAHLQQILASKRQHLQSLDELHRNIDRSAHQLDNALASMGLIYKQLLLLVSSKDVAGGRLNRLQAEITEKVQCLEDLTSAIDEVYRADL
jgi:hypothetical protein